MPRKQKKHHDPPRKLRAEDYAAYLHLVLRMSERGPIAFVLEDDCGHAKTIDIRDRVMRIDGKETSAATMQRLIALLPGEFERLVLEAVRPFDGGMMPLYMNVAELADRAGYALRPADITIHDGNTDHRILISRKQDGDVFICIDGKETGWDDACRFIKSHYTDFLIAMKPVMKDLRTRKSVFEMNVYRNPFETSRPQETDKKSEIRDGRLFVNMDAFLGMDKPKPEKKKEEFHPTMADAILKKSGKKGYVVSTGKENK